MRRIALMSWLVFLAATVCGGVWAAERMVAKPCTAVAVVPPLNLASLQPTQELPLSAGKIVAVDAKDGRLIVRHSGVARFDKIKFDVAREGKRYIITRIENSL
jgi:multidrug efflux pump subunit AcrA (membrane-fusion protein)